MASRFLPDSLARGEERLVPVNYNQADRLALAYGPAGWRRAPIAFGLRLRGPAELALLESALTCVARRHTALRMYFPGLAGARFGACLHPSDVTWPIELIDLTGASENDRAHAEHRQAEILTRHFQADRPPLCRAVVWKYGPQDCLLGIAVDHLIFDGISIGLFLADLERIYRHLKAGGQARDLLVEVSDFAEFCQSEESYLTSKAAARSLRFWEEAWQGCGPWPRSVTPSGSPSEASRAGRISQRELEAAAVDAAIRRFTGGRLSLFAFAAGCVLSAVSDVTGRADCGLLYSTARRSRPGAARLIGCLTNRMLLRVDLASATGLDAVIATTRTAILDSLDHEMMPFEYLISQLRPDLTGQRPDQPHLALNVDAAPPAPALDGVEVSMTWPVADRSFRDDMRIVLSLQEDGDQPLALKCGYQAGLFDPEFIEGLMDLIADRLSGARS